MFLKCHFLDVSTNCKLEIKKFGTLANGQRNGYCSTDTITNQDTKANLHSVKTEYKFLHLPHNSHHHFIPTRGLIHAVIILLLSRIRFVRLMASVWKTVCQKLPGHEKFTNTKFTRQELHKHGKTDATNFPLLAVNVVFLRRCLSGFLVSKPVLLCNVHMESYKHVALFSRCFQGYTSSIWWLLTRSTSHRTF
jgi:hypothetical protein